MCIFYPVYYTLSCSHGKIDFSENDWFSLSGYKTSEFIQVHEKIWNFQLE